MSRRRMGQEKFGFAVDRGPHSSLYELAGTDQLDTGAAVSWRDFLLCEGRASLAANGLVQGDAAVDLV